MPATIVFDLTGQRFGRLTAIKYAKRGRWLCKCECGNQKLVRTEGLRRGTSRSCGCLANELLSKRTRTHGRSKTPMWHVWLSMRQRCENPKHQAYENYGGRGIKVCDRWSSSFENFVEDMGERPSDKHSIDRINNDGNYEPGNCRWVERIEQEHNKRSNRLLTYENETLPISVWERRLGVKKGAIRDRIRRGWSVEKAMKTPIRKRRSSSNENNNG